MEIAALLLEVEALGTPWTPTLGDGIVIINIIIIIILVILVILVIVAIFLIIVA